MLTCPTECKEERDRHEKSIIDLFNISISPRAQQIVVYLIGLLFLVYAGSWVYNVSTFATKDDLREVKVDLKEDIAQGFKLIKAELSKR